MSVLVPDTRLLAAHWPMQDAAGITEFDQVISGTSIAGADVDTMQIYPGTAGAGYPIRRTDGPNSTYPIAWRFSTGDGTSAWPTNIEFCQSFEPAAQDTGLGPLCWEDDRYQARDRAISVRFRRHTNVAAPIYGLGLQYNPISGPAGQWWYSEPSFFFYFGISGTLHFGFRGVSYATQRKDSVNSGQMYMDGEWHEAVGTVRADDEWAGGNYSTFCRRMDLYVDGVHLGYKRHAGGYDDWTAVELGNSLAFPFFLGSGFMYRTTTLIHWPDTVRVTSNGACGSDLCDARVYCGTLVPTPPGPSISSIMFSCNT